MITIEERAKEFETVTLQNLKRKNGIRKMYYAEELARVARSGYIVGAYSETKQKGFENESDADADAEYTPEPFYSVRKHFDVLLKIKPSQLLILRDNMKALFFGYYSRDKSGVVIFKDMKGRRVHNVFKFRKYNNE